MADAEAIAEAASRPTMRFVEVKSEDQQASAMAYRTRQMCADVYRPAHPIDQRLTLASGRARRDCRDEQEWSEKAFCNDRRRDGGYADKVRGIARIHVAQIEGLTAQIAEMTEAMKTVATTSPILKRLQTVPGVGLQTAMAMETFAPDLTCFTRGRDFSAWLGLVPRQNSTGGKSRLGKVSKMGQVDIRSHLIRGAMSVITAASRFGFKENSWLERLLARKPKLVAVMMTKNEDYRNPEAVT